MVFEVCKELIQAGVKGNISKIITQCPGAEVFVGGVLGGLIALGITIILFLFLGFYIYSSFAWYTIAKKLKYNNAWLAWIPILNIAMVLQLGGFYWAWIFLLLGFIPGWIALFVILIIAQWRIFEKRKYPGWFSLSVIIPKVGGILYLIVIGFIAWGKGMKK